MSIDTLTQRVFISPELVILLSIEEDLVDVIVIKVVNVAYMRRLKDGDWLLLLLLVLMLLQLVCFLILIKVCFGLNYRRCEVLLERRAIMLQGLILTQNAVTHCKRSRCNISNRTTSCCNRSCNSES